jgi:polyisoprenoid-binding protein YceI
MMTTLQARPDSSAAFARIAAALVALAVLGLAAAPPASAANADPAAMPAGHYQLDKSHAFLTGKVSHFGLSMFVFRFDRFDASYDYDPKAPDDAALTVSIDVNSLDTGDAKVDQQFAAEFMGAKRTPMATFTATKITRVGDKGAVAGDLTLNGVTRPVVLDVIFNGYGMEAIMGHRAGFSATTVIKRSEFGLGKYVGMVGDDVTLDINVEFARR